MKIDPKNYHEWYESPSGSWMGMREFALLRHLLPAQSGETVLDVGCGSGFFSSHLVEIGLDVTGLDINYSMLNFARQRDNRISYLQGQAECLPFAAHQFDYAVAMTSLCFTKIPEKALQELWRVSRRAVVLGLLHRHSLLWWQKRNSKGYNGVRWDTLAGVRTWINKIHPTPHFAWRYALFVPSAAVFARQLEFFLPSSLPLGGFLAVALYH